MKIIKGILLDFKILLKFYRNFPEILWKNLKTLEIWISMGTKIFLKLAKNNVTLQNLNRFLADFDEKRLILIKIKDF